MESFDKKDPPAGHTKGFINVVEVILPSDESINNCNNFFNEDSDLDNIIGDNSWRRDSLDSERLCIDEQQQHKSKIGREFLDLQNKLEYYQDQTNILSTLLRIIAKWISATLDIHLFGQDHTIRKGTTLAWNEIERISKILTTHSQSIKNLKKVNKPIKPSNQKQPRKSLINKETKFGQTGSSVPEPERVIKNKVDEHNSTKFDNVDIINPLSSRPKRSCRKSINYRNLAEGGLEELQNPASDQNPDLNCTSTNKFELAPIESKNNVGNDCKDPISKNIKLINKDHGASMEPELDIQIKKFKSDHDQDAPPSPPPPEPENENPINNSILEETQVQEVQINDTEKETEEEEEFNPSFIQLDGNSYRTIQQVVESTDEHNTTTLILKETDLIQLYKNQNRIPKLILDRERFYKQQRKLLQKKHFEPSYSNGCVIRQTCKKCGAILGKRIEGLTSHLAACSPEVLRSGNKYYLQKRGHQSQVQAKHSNPTSTVWSYFTTTKIGYKRLDSFCKKCCKRIDPKAHRLIDHLEVCGGDETLDDGFWETLPKSKGKKMNKPQPIMTKIVRKNQVSDMKLINNKEFSSTSQTDGKSNTTTTTTTTYQYRPTVCQVCGKVIKHGIGGLKIHMAIHSKKRPFKCEQCPKSFKLRNTLKNHILVIHEGVKIPRKNPPIRKGNKRPEPIIIDESEPEEDEISGSNANNNNNEQPSVKVDSSSRKMRSKLS